ncbi:hypothetical protein GIB67_021184 [Kingdonia uniflora]|uniref:Uncharacterized protein n=1 Tax=Kingdonia uniflora TaxID=39325 RepID=A0A7J7LFN5_9MAGN|nr:hypothetical protein GIB67_021184 [Kingdonia uniflora]
MNANKKNKKAEKADVPLKKKGLANRMTRKRLAEFPELENIQSTVENLLHQVAPGEGLEVVKDLMVDDNVEVGKEVQTMRVAEVAKNDIVFFNQEEVIGEAYQASAYQTTNVSVEEHTIEVKKTEDEASQASVDQTTVVSVEEQTIEVVQTKVVISHQEEDVDKASQSKESKKEVEQDKVEVVEGKDDDYGNL